MFVPPLDAVPFHRGPKSNRRSMAVKAQADFGGALPAASMVFAEACPRRPGGSSSANWGARTRALNSSMYGDARSQASEQSRLAAVHDEHNFESGAVVDVRQNQTVVDDSSGSTNLKLP